MLADHLLPMKTILEPPLEITRFLPKALPSADLSPTGDSGKREKKSYSVTTDDQRFALIEKILSKELTLRQVSLVEHMNRRPLTSRFAIRLRRQFSKSSIRRAASRRRSTDKKGGLATTLPPLTTQSTSQNSPWHP